MQSRNKKIRVFGNKSYKEDYFGFLRPDNETSIGLLFLQKSFCQYLTMISFKNKLFLRLVQTPSAPNFVLIISCEKNKLYGGRCLKE
jgi:hypothetical protein